MRKMLQELKILGTAFHQIIVYPDIHIAIPDNIAEFGKDSTVFIIEGTNREEFRGTTSTN